MTFLFSNVFGVWMVLKYFWNQPAGIKACMAQITSCRNVTSIVHTASAVIVALWQVLPFREGENYIQFS